jgi:23S rRNA pseudouridine2605 synthase
VHTPKDNQKRTLDRVLSKFGVGSRTEARSWIGAGRVTVNGKKVQTPDVWIDPENDRVELDGRPLTARQKQYILLYKPKGYLTTYKDPEGRPTVYDLLTTVKDFVFPVGRLDQDTTGLLILTNDSAFGDHITSPESKVPKTYLVKASILLDDAQLDQLRHGLTLADGPTRPALVKRIRDSAKYSFFEITITEGRNRQVRRMVEALGAKVLKLVRTAIGGIEIGSLEIGKYRALTAEERLALGGMSKKPSRPGRPGVRPDRPQDQQAAAPRRNGKLARWAGGNRRRGHNESARKP